MIFEHCLVREVFVKSLLNGSECVCADFADCQLEVAVALALKLARDLVCGLSGEAGIYTDKVVYTVLALAHAYAGVGVGNRALELADYRVLVVENIYHRVRVFVRLRHFLGRVGK